MEYVGILRRLRKLPGVKKVFVRSGIRYDYLNADPNPTFLQELVQHHISGQLKVAPEHCVNHVLDKMGKPHIQDFDRFCKRFYEETKRIGKEQYLVPYLMSSHPGCTIADAVELALYLKRHHMRPSRCRTSTLPPAPTPPVCSTPALTRRRWSRSMCPRARRKNSTSAPCCNITSRKTAARSLRRSSTPTARI